MNLHSLHPKRSDQPLTHTEIVLVDRRRIELRISACKADVFPLALAAHLILYSHKAVD